MARREYFVAQFGGARRNRTDDILLAKQALSLLSYGPELVHKDGIEPPTRAPSTRRSTSELPVRVGTFSVQKMEHFQEKACPRESIRAFTPVFAGYGWNPVFRPKMRQCEKWSGRGESNSSSTRRQRATLPLSYGRALLGGD